jgi:hypothetical protein
MGDAGRARNSSIPCKIYLVCLRLALSSRCGLAVRQNCILAGAEHPINSAVKLPLSEILLVALVATPQQVPRRKLFKYLPII